MGGKNHGKVTDEERKQTLQEDEKIAAEEKDAEIAVEEKNAVGKCLPAVAGVGQGCDDKAEEEEDEHGDVDDDEDDGANDEGEEAVRWVTHYSSGQEILLVGEGDFSFSLSLARSFRSASNIVATSLDNYSQVTSKYSRAKSNIGNLKKMGARLLHGVDATQMKHHKDLKLRKFDRIIFNFPHAGFKGKEEDLRLINMHKKLVYGFFRDASHMIRQNGEIHISHKTSFPFCQWKLEELASYNSLVLFKCVDFKIGDYPGYNNKRGDGQRCDQPFYLGKCCTFMFQIGKPLRRKPPAANVANLGGMLLSTPLPQRRSNFVPIESEGYVLLDRQRPPSFVPGYCRMLAYAGAPERNPNCSPIASGGHIFLRTRTHPNSVPDLRVISTSPGLPERNLHCVSIASDANLPLHTQRPPTTGYRRYASSWPSSHDGEGLPGRFLLPNCLPIPSGGRLFLSNPHSVSFTSDAHLLFHTPRPLTAGYEGDENGQLGAWPDGEGFTGRSLLQTRHQHLGYVTGLEEMTGSPSMISGGFRGELLQSASIRPGFISEVEDSVRKELHEYMSESPGRTLHGYAAHLRELHSSNVQRMERLKRRLLFRLDP